MIYHVEISVPALLELEDAYLWVAARAPRNVDRWYGRLMKAIESLNQLPTRCGLAPENDAFDVEIRQLLFGKRRGVFRILFTISGDRVRILHVVRGSRRFLDLGR